jgi:glycosyltransferase involved in cell wall biosynthesis
MLPATIQLCTYNRAHLLGRVLAGCFEQTAPAQSYEVVLVDDGSIDATPAVIEAMRARAECAFTVLRQPNAGLAAARNAGIACAAGERIIFIDDDVLPTPAFVAEHLRSHARAPHAIVRGGVINTASFERLPPPYWTLRDYSGNFFWTTNVSLPLETLRRVGAFNRSFLEYGWEDIELGMRLRRAGVRAVFNREALVYHYKPRPLGSNVEGMLRQARAQARTALHLGRIHAHWRVTLATGNDPLQRSLHRLARALGVRRAAEAVLGRPAADRPLTGRQLLAARTLAREAYFEELDCAAARTR